MRIVVLATIALLVSCGGDGWTPKDETSLRAAIQADRAIDTICAPSDAGLCSPTTVRALEHSSICNLGATLHRHRVDLVDAGDCTP